MKSIHQTVKDLKRKQTKGQSLKYYDYEELEKIVFGMVKAKLTDPQTKAVKYLIVNNQLSMAGLSGHMRAINSLEKMGVVENDGFYYRLDKGGEVPFVECKECIEKPGTPILCKTCLDRRGKSSFIKAFEEVKTVGDKDIWKERELRVPKKDSLTVTLPPGSYKVGRCEAIIKEGTYRIQNEPFKKTNRNGDEESYITTTITRLS